MNQENPQPNNGNSDRIFLYEVVLPSSADQGENRQNWQNRQAKVIFKVPYSRMNQEMKRIAKLGGKILKITPISGLENPSDIDPHLSWWIEISTHTPHCLYYFGPFDSKEEAQESQLGYIEDLEEEGALEIKVEITQIQPTVLTQELD